MKRLRDIQKLLVQGHGSRAVIEGALILVVWDVASEYCLLDLLFHYILYFMPSGAEQIESLFPFALSLINQEKD